MNLFDIILSLFFLVVAYFGYSKGIVRQLNNQTNLFIALIFAFYFFGKVSFYLVNDFSVPSFLSKIVAFVLVFLFVIFVLYIFTLLIEKLIKMMRLSFLNQILGGLFSFLKFVLFLLIPFFIFSTLNNKFQFYSASNQSFWYSFYQHLIGYFSSNFN